MQIIRPKKRKGSFFLLFAAVLVIAAAASVLFVTALQDGELVVAAKPASSQAESVGEQEPSRPASSALESSAPASSALESSAQEPELLLPQDRYLVLVNAEHKMPDSFVPDLADYDSIQMDRQALEAYREMLEAAQEDGVNLWISSAYRSVELQAELFEREVEQNQEAGMPPEEAEAAAGLLVQRPGYSEHATGLAIDFNGVTTDFEDDEAYQWLLENAGTYGFVLRYPLDKVELTGIDYEPWHFRYVGPEYAEEMNRLGYCLEEYVYFLAEQAAESAAPAESAAAE